MALIRSVLPLLLIAGLLLVPAARRPRSAFVAFAQGAANHIEGLFGIKLCTPLWRFLTEQHQEAWDERWELRPSPEGERFFSTTRTFTAARGNARYDLEVVIQQGRVAIVRVVFWSRDNRFLTGQEFFQTVRDALRVQYPAQPFGPFTWQVFSGIEPSFWITDPHGNGLEVFYYRWRDDVHVKVLARGAKGWFETDPPKAAFCSPIPGMTEPARPPGLVVLTGGTPVQLHLQGTWSIDAVRRGDTWEVPIVEDVRAEGAVVFPKGTKAIARASRDPLRRGFFQTLNNVEFAFEPLVAPDGTRFRLVRQGPPVVLTPRGLFDTDVVWFSGTSFQLRFRDSPFRVDMVVPFYIDKSRVVKLSTGG